MEFALARYSLRFKHPFGTAHGLRDGTDSVFVRIRRMGSVGYGEATLPPYLSETQDSVHEELERFWLKFGRGSDASVGRLPVNELSAPARAALQVSHRMLILNELNGLTESNDRLTWSRSAATCMVTLGHTEVGRIPLKLSELPAAPILKVKLGASNDREFLRALRQMDDRKLFLDANQGWTSVDQALAAIELVGVERVVGLEQPFAKDRWDLHAQLSRECPVPVYGDESIQGPDDLERAPEAFGGVNLKLMKCGGLDVAEAMAERARELGLQVMLGSMSESTLGCGAMASLQHLADLADLDGPWLISNDPFEGLEMHHGRLVVEGLQRIKLKEPSLLEFRPIGA
ncbi:MAG: enolase C-terminal domain-like protein [Flavobacteriales bacterium]